MTTIGEFLRTRRACIQPGDVGLADIGRRRVPGLRREEVAALAGVGVDYYVRLEQGRATSVSDAVLDAIAAALQLNETERAYLRVLSRPERTYAARQQRVRPGVQRMLDMMIDVPAFVLGRRMEVLAWNALGNAVMGFTSVPAKRRNMPWLAFRHPDARTIYRDWPAVAAEVVAYLRLDVARHPKDLSATAVVTALTIQDETFRRLWERHDVRGKTFGAKLMRHPIAGELDLSYETADLPADEDQLLVVFTAQGGSPTEERLRMLASWSAATVST